MRSPGAVVRAFLSSLRSYKHPKPTFSPPSLVRYERMVSGQPGADRNKLTELEIVPVPKMSPVDRPSPALPRCVSC